MHKSYYSSVLAFCFKQKKSSDLRMRCCSTRVHRIRCWMNMAVLISNTQSECLTSGRRYPAAYCFDRHNEIWKIFNKSLIQLEAPPIPPAKTHSPLHVFLLLTSSIISFSLLISSVSSVIWAPLSSVRPFITQQPFSGEAPSSVCLSGGGRLLVLLASFSSVRVTPCRTVTSQLHIS